ncbi:MAG: transposase [Oscillospiraceae bacterium]|nr:transposase [Oscillospiraceae bacterium]
MYKFPSRQISIEDFGMPSPSGVKLNSENHWVQKAVQIPWDEIKKRHTALFKNHKGNVAKPLRLALSALIINTKRGLSDVETALQIQETPCLQYFCGMGAYEDKLPFAPSLMVYFRKGLTPEILGEINEMIRAKMGHHCRISRQAAKAMNPNHRTKGPCIVDASCAPQKIRYSQDSSLLNEARENLEGMADELHEPTDSEKPRTYRKRARREYIKFSKKRKKTFKEIRKAVKPQLQYIRRDLRIVDELLEKERRRQSGSRNGYQPSDLYEQQLLMYNNRNHTIADRIVSF